VTGSILRKQHRLLGSIVSEATYLCNALTENTLQLVHLANAAQDIRRDWESMEEIVGAVLGRVRQRDPAKRIQSRVAHALPLIKADPVLLAQLAWQPAGTTPSNTAQDSY
jgi:two-component system sensor histidine kinase KdpD